MTEQTPIAHVQAGTIVCTKCVTVEDIELMRRKHGYWLRLEPVYPGDPDAGKVCQVGFETIGE